MFMSQIGLKAGTLSSSLAEARVELSIIDEPLWSIHVHSLCEWSTTIYVCNEFHHFVMSSAPAADTQAAAVTGAERWWAG